MTTQKQTNITQYAPEMYIEIEKVLAFLADLNGSNAFAGESVWAKDMRQRCINNQKALFELKKRIDK